MSTKTSATTITVTPRYHRLTRDNRIIIYTLRKGGSTLSEIGEAVGCDKSTVSRELRRNKSERGYRYEKAQEMADQRVSEKVSRPRKFTECIWNEAKDKLKEGWTFGQISGRAKRDGRPTVCKETLYKEYYKRQRDVKAGRSDEYLPPLPRRRAKRKTRDKDAKKYRTAGRGRIKDRVDIDERPAIVDHRTRVGHWEGDLINGLNGTGHLVTMAERMTRFTLVTRVSSKNSSEVMNAIIEMLSDIPEEMRKTSTFDNGKEFASFKMIESALGFKVYFAKPYHSCERGTNENRNGIVRRVLPKGSRFDDQIDEKLKKVDYMLNDRPMKCLNWRTPREAFMRLVARRT